MNLSKIWLSSPHMGGTEQTYVNEAFAANWVAPLGPNVTELENSIENYLGNNSHVAALSSGTAAIHLALVMLDVKPGDYVICQSFTFSASANPIMYLGATPIFVDSEEETWNICPQALTDAIKFCESKGKLPKAIIAVHLYGMPFNVKEIRQVADTYSIPIVEDSAEALGSLYDEQKCGTFGDIGILSFNGNKIITTSGGGALVAHTKALKDKAVFLATQARDNAPHYQHSEVGYNYRLSNICAGIGRGQMEVLDTHVALRQQMNTFYVNYFKNNADVTVFSEPNELYKSNHWLSALTLNAGSKRTSEDLRLALEKQNIESRPLWKPMHLQPIFNGYNYFGGNVAENLFTIGLCLPSGSNLSNDDRDRIEDVFNRFFL